MTSKARVASCTKADAGVRLRVAEAYLEMADFARSDDGPDELLTVSAGLAVLAGIAASDAICCVRLKSRHRGDDHRGDDHRGAIDLLRGATPDGDDLARIMARLLDLKDESHYGVVFVAARKSRDAVKWARRLVDRAREELER
jgi:hypothetical protein